MAISNKILGQVAPAVGAAADLYTVPAGKSAVCSTLSVCNLGSGTASYSIRCRKNGDALMDKQLFASNATLTGNETVLLTVGITVGAGDIISVSSGIGSVAFQLFGAEVE